MNWLKKIAYWLSFPGSFGSGVYTGTQLVDQEVVIRPPLSEAYLEYEPSKLRLKKQLEDAGIEVVVDDIVKVESVSETAVRDNK